MKYFVIDTNYLRDTDFLARLQGAIADEAFILTDTTILETMKTQFWQSDAQKSFSLLLPHLHRIVLSKAVSDLIRIEINNRDSIRGLSQLIDPDLSAGFGQLVKEIVTGIPSQSLPFATANIGAAQRALANHQLNASLNQRGLEMAVIEIKKAFDMRGFRRTTDASQKELLRHYGIKDMSQKATRIALVQGGVPEAIAEQMSSSDCVCLRQTIGLYCLGWKWAFAGCLPRRLEKVTNELMDLDQSLIGSYCAGVLTREPSVAVLRQDILRILFSHVRLAT